MSCPDGFIVVANAAADAAGQILRHYFRSGVAVELKGDDSPVTLADRNAENAIRTVLNASFPDHAVLGEETGLRPGAGRFRWVVDPIDGTRAFITGRPSFGTLIALLDDDTPILGILDQPITGERWVGCAGQPTRFNGVFGGGITTPPRRCLAACELSATSPRMFDADQSRRWGQLADRVGRVSYGGDCYAYGLLALGHIDIVAEAQLKIWDWAALLPIVQGAGGSLTDWAGTPLTAQGDGCVLALANPALLPDIVAVLRGTHASRPPEQPQVHIA